MADHQNLCVIPTDTPRTQCAMDSGLRRSDGFSFSVQHEDTKRVRDPEYSGGVMGSRVKHEDLSKFNRHSDLIRMPTTTLGFTLVELAIALMVIGLLIGGVLKGQELIENAKSARTIKDVMDYDTAIVLFEDRYGDFPGDLRNASARLPNCTTYPCNNTVAVGTGYLNTTHFVKRANFWRHLERAGFINNINEHGDHHTTSPLNAFGGHNSVDYNNTDFGNALVPDDDITYYSLIYMFDPSVGHLLISPVRMSIMDHKVDDGRPLTGTVRLKASYAGTSPAVNNSLCLNTSTNTYLNNRKAPCVGWRVLDSMN